MGRYRILACFLGGALLYSAQAQAEEDGQIVVLGEELPVPPGTTAYGSVLIGRDRLVDSASDRLENILTDVAGFQQFRRSDSRSANPSAQGATLRAIGGNASSRTLVLLDGVPMADPFFGYIPFDALVPDRLGAVRVTRGSGAGAFGAGAVAGTIELVSADRTMLPAIGASAFYGSDDATQFSGGINGDLGNGYVSLSGRWDHGDGFWTTPRDQRSAASVPAAYDGWSVSLRAVAPLTDGMDIQARALVFDDDRTLRFAGADNHIEGQDASVRVISRGPWQVDALAYVQARNFSNIVISSSLFTPVLDQYATPATGVGGKIEVRPPVGGAHVLRLGVDVRRTSGRMQENAISAVSGDITARRRASGRQTVAGLFVEDDWVLGPLILTGGARADRWTIADGVFHSFAPATGVTTQTDYPDRQDWQFSGRMGAVYRFNEAWALRAAAYTGFRLPTLNELYRPFTVFPVTTLANAALKPEKLKGYEAGVDFTPATGVSLNATVFYNRLRNAVGNVTIGANLNQRQNLDAVVAKGAELTANVALGNVSLSASYAYTHSRVDAPGQPADGLSPVQSPRHNASATLAWSSEKGANLSATVHYVGKQYEDDLHQNALPDALTVDAFAQLPVTKGISLVGRVENLFDARVVTRNSGGNIDLGTPRILWVGLRFTR